MAIKSVPWSESDLSARLCRALDTARDAAELFGVAGYRDAYCPENSFLAEKPISETAMLLYATSAANRLPEVSAKIEEVARTIAPHARSSRAALQIALHPALGLDFAFTHILLTKLGFGDPCFDDYVKSCLQSQSSYVHERPPFASLEQRWLESVWTGSALSSGWNVDLLRSALNGPIDILGGLRDDAYAFTHILMYCTDFGNQSCQLPRKRSHVMDDASSLLAKCLDDEDYDLAAEVLLFWPLTGAPWTATASFGFRVLALVEDRVGILPGGTTNTERLRSLSGLDKTRYRLGTGYHTAIVMGILCATSLRLGQAPTTNLAGPLVETRFLERLSCIVDHDRGHWRSPFQNLSDTEQRTLGPLLLDIAIAQQYRKRDFEALREVLALACEYGLAKSPLCRQAAGLLERLAHCSRAINPLG